MQFKNSQEWQSHPIRFATSLLEYKDKRKLFFVTLTQTFLGILDLLGIAIFGILGALSISGIQSKNPGGRIQSVLEVLNISNLEFQSQVAILALLAASLLIGRTALSAFISKRTLRFLSFRAANISSQLVEAVLREPLLATQNRIPQNVIFGSTGAINSLVIGVIGSIVALFADLNLLFILFLGLLIVDVSLAFSTLVFFGLIGLILHRIMHTNANILGKENSRLQIEINSSLNEAISSKREILVRNRIFYYVNNFTASKRELAVVEADQAFLPNVSKYVLESSVFLGALLICGYQFLSQDAVRAIGNLSVFLAAGMRIAPAVLRVQQGYLSIRMHSGAAQPALELMSELNITKQDSECIEKIDFDHVGFVGECRLTNVNFQYSGRGQWSLSNVNLEIDAGSFVAIVGSSGAGKTTLADLLLGLIQPDSGNVDISGLPATKALQAWPGEVGYVPQETFLMNASVKENVALGFSNEEIDIQRVEQALRIASLGKFVSELEQGMNSELGNRGLNLSGGQRQRMGIARALYTNPKLLVLDEATSALDAETENSVSEALQKLRGVTTIIAIAHRLSTVMLADNVIYLEDGRILAQGNFEEVRVSVPNFDHQAKLLGL